MQSKQLIFFLFIVVLLVGDCSHLHCHPPCFVQLGMWHLAYQVSSYHLTSGDRNLGSFSCRCAFCVIDIAPLQHTSIIVTTSRSNNKNFLFFRTFENLKFHHQHPQLFSYNGHTMTWRNEGHHDRRRHSSPNKQCQTFGDDDRLVKGSPSSWQRS